MRPDDVAEQRLVVAARQPVVAAVLLVGDAARQVVDGFNVIVDDRLVADRRTDDTILPLAKRCEQRFDASHSQDGLFLANTHANLPASSSCLPRA